MTKTTPHPLRASLPLVRCAVYTRKSTDEGLQQEFNSLDAQRESAEAFVLSQQHEGWTCIPDRFDDGGFTGGNMDRPGLKRLMADIDAGKVDCVVVYKVDRLSRSLLDFAAMMQTFEKNKVSFVSVTQQFNTATSMGRLVLNVLLSFAQFEREIISERTRDKIAATRRRGKWTGGQPPLGYDVDPKGNRLVINEAEAVRVRAIFDLYLEHGSMLPVVKELEHRGWTNKRWTAKDGRECGGFPLTRTNLHRLLTNVVYVGKVRYKTEIHPGEHPAIVGQDVFQRVQAVLSRNGRSGGILARSQFGMLLQGLIRCAPCGCTMTPSYTSKKKSRQYRYYTCTGAQKRGWHTCPSKSVPAAEIERVVVDQIRAVGRDPELLRATLDAARAQDDARLAELAAERTILERDLARWHAEMKRLAGQVGAGEPNEAVISRLAELQERLRNAEERRAKALAQADAVRRQGLDEQDAAAALAAFDPVWDALSPREQSRVVRMLVAGVDYDGAARKVKIAFHAHGIKTLADEIADGCKEKIA